MKYIIGYVRVHYDISVKHEISIVHYWTGGDVSTEKYIATRYSTKEEADERIEEMRDLVQSAYGYGGRYTRKMFVRIVNK